MKTPVNAIDSGTLRENPWRKRPTLPMSADVKPLFNAERFIRKWGRSIRKRIYWPQLRRKFAEKWTVESGKEQFVKRSYNSYEDYVEHQRAKLGLHDLEKYDVKFREVLRERLSNSGICWNGRTVLCLGARIGTEVKAFVDVGCFAVGIDLNPGKGNRYVVQGDFHDLQYAADSIDFVFTNSLDHAFDIHRIVGEIHRVLKPEGRLIIEAVAGQGEGSPPGFFESFFWAKIDDLATLIEQSGFRLSNRVDFECPWKGQQLWFEKKFSR